MEWDKFYQSDAISFAEHSRLVTPALNYLDRQFHILNPMIRRVFVLGGFHPFNGTPQQFLDFAHRIHPNSSDIHLLLDMNRMPLTSVDPQTFPNRVQAKIEYMPLKSQTVDYLSMDNTIDFMDDQQVKNFAKSAAEALTANGVILITKSALFLRSQYHPFETFIHYALKRNRTRFSSIGLISRIPVYYRDARKMISLMPELKLVFLEELFSRDILVFSRHDSKFEPAMGRFKNLLSYIGL